MQSPCELTLDLSEAQRDGFLLACRYTLLDHDCALQHLMDAALAQNVANPAVAAVIPAAFWQAMREAKLVSERAPLPIIGA